MASHDLTGRKALVTGGARGIGAGIAQALAAAGASVVIGDILAIVGTMLGMKHAFRAMRPNGSAGKGGAIVNTASVAATIAFPRSPAIRQASQPSIARPASPRWRPASSATAYASTASTPAWCRPTWA